jgi:hypothetical protein
MPEKTESVHELVELLAASASEGASVNLTRNAVNITLTAIRAYSERVASLPAPDATVSFQVEELDWLDLPHEVVAFAANEGYARIILEQAQRIYPDR